MRWPAVSMVSVASMKTAGWSRRSETRARIRLPTRCLVLVAGHGVELARNLEVEERRKAGIGLDELQHDRASGAGKPGSPRGTRSRARFGLHQGAAVEGILRAEQRDELRAVALLHRALDDHVEGSARRLGGDHRFARAKVADVHRGAQRLDFLWHRADRKAGLTRRMLLASRLSLSAFRIADGRSAGGRTGRAGLNRRGRATRLPAPVLP